jgi:hypothetical protein
MPLFKEYCIEAIFNFNNDAVRSYVHVYIENSYQWV